MNKKDLTLEEYSSIHGWIKTRLGKANKCTSPICKGISKKFEWALKKGCIYERNTKNFISLCKSCHTIMDRSVGDEWKYPKPEPKFRWEHVSKTCDDCGAEFMGVRTRIYCKECLHTRDRESKIKWYNKNITIKGKPERLCLVCKKEPIGRNKIIKYCGSWAKKTGCSYEMHKIGCRLRLSKDKAGDIQKEIKKLQELIKKMI